MQRLAFVRLLGRQALQLGREARDVDAVAHGVALVGRVRLLEKVGDVLQKALLAEGQILAQNLVLLVALRKVDEDLRLQTRVDVLGQIEGRSVVAGVKIKAHPLFRFVATMNDDSSTFDLPEYIHSRLQPQILIDFPEREEERAILRENLPFADDKVLDYVTDFLQQAHAAEERYTVRDGINIGRYAIKLTTGLGHGVEPLRVIDFSIRQVLGEEALRYVRRRG